MTNADAKQHVDTRPRQRPGSTSQSTWRYATAGLSASLVGLGLARFSYTPLIPALIAAKWFSASDVVYLGAANLAGYLAGALAARAVADRIGAVHALRAMMLLATLSFFASSAPVSFTWFFAWRFLSGLTGGIIMVLAASAVLPHTSPAKRGIVGGYDLSRQYPDLGNALLVCATETRTDEDIAQYAKILGEVLK